MGSWFRVTQGPGSPASGSGSGSTSSGSATQRADSDTKLIVVASQGAPSRGLPPEHDQKADESTATQPGQEQQTANRPADHVARQTWRVEKLPRPQSALPLARVEPGPAPLQAYPAARSTFVTSIVSPSGPRGAARQEHAFPSVPPPESRSRTRPEHDRREQYVVPAPQHSSTRTVRNISCACAGHGGSSSNGPARERATTKHHRFPSRGPWASRMSRARRCLAERRRRAAVPSLLPAVSRTEQDRPARPKRGSSMAPRKTKAVLGLAPEPSPDSDSPHPRLDATSLVRISPLTGT